MVTMSYDMARVFECTRTGQGASVPEIKRLLEWPLNRIIKASKALHEEACIDIHARDGEMFLQATAWGEDAYKRFNDIPF